MFLLRSGVVSQGVRRARLCVVFSGHVFLGSIFLALTACSLGSDEPQVPEDSAAEIEDSVFEIPPWYSTPLFSDVWDGFSVEGVPVPSAEERKVLYKRGAYLVRAAGACVVCHGENPNDPNSPLSGGRVVTDSFGEVRAANITPDPSAGIGGWSVEEVTRAIRASISKNEKPISLDLHQGYRWISDEDAKAIAVFLLAQEAVPTKVERRELSDFTVKDWGMFSRHTDVKGYVPSLPEKTTKQYGRYLAKHVAGCERCHTPEGGFFSSEQAFAGTEEKRGGNLFVALGQLLMFFTPENPDPRETRDEVSSVLSDSGKEQYDKTLEIVGDGPSAADGSVSWLDSSLAEEVEKEVFPVPGPDIRATSTFGIQNWREDDVVAYLETGSSLDSGRSDPSLCPWPSYRLMSRKDKQAIARFLMSL